MAVTLFWTTENARPRVERSESCASVAQGKTLRATAQSLHIDQSTVSRRVAALEEALGVRLFERLEGAMTATPAAKSSSKRQSE
jgi:DNA-binding transcriptional LysR family regulator